MKKQISLFVFALIIQLSVSAFSFEEKGKVIVVSNKASWCSVCKTHTPRTIINFKANNQDGFFKVILNDISNEETLKASQKALEEAGLAASHAHSLAAGVLSFYDAKSKKLLAQITIAHSDAELKMLMDMLRKKVN